MRKSADRKAQIRKACVPLTGLICAFYLQIFSDGVYPPSATSRTIFFLFPIVFGINLIQFFDEKKGGAAGNSIACFGASIHFHAI